MKKYFGLIAASLLAIAAVSCNKTDNGPWDVTIQLMSDGAALAQEGVTIEVADATGTATYTQTTDASGKAVFPLKAGAFVASSVFTNVVDGVKYSYSGSVTVYVSDASVEAAACPLPLIQVSSSQLIIKELYSGGCPQNTGVTAYQNDSYIVIYNNSDVVADASDLVIGMCGPYNGEATNKYVSEGKLSYESESWIPSIGAIWRFQGSVTIPAYSQIVVACFSAIDHTATVTASVDLSKSSYYWMSNEGISQYSNKKYDVSNNIPKANYLTCTPFTMGNAWALSVASPAVFIGKMPASELDALVNNTDGYDHTMGTNAAFNVVKFPKEDVLDVVEVFNEAKVDTSNPRFSADINSGYVPYTNKLGYTVYRNVDKDATEAIEGNSALIVTGYAGGVEKSTDPSGIDAEASAAKGAKIVYSDTNNTSKDFHQRAKSSLK